MKALFSNCNSFSPQVPQTAEDWLAVSEGFEATWNMPHCVGAVDGKHFRITRPPSSGSYFFNYKHYYSLVLMAVVDSEYRFIFIDAGSEGKASDGGVWARTSLQRMLTDQENPLHLPEPAPIDGIDEDIPYFMVGDDAFPLKPTLMKPYPQLNLTLRQRIFNYRLSRSRRVVENAFGILTTKFRLFRQEMTMHPDGCQTVIAAAVVLHNMLREKCGKKYIPAGVIDVEDDDHNLITGQWRQEEPLDRIERFHPGNVAHSAKEVRDRLAAYFVSGAGEVHWQYENIA